MQLFLATFLQNVQNSFFKNWRKYPQKYFHSIVDKEILNNASECYEYCRKCSSQRMWDLSTEQIFINLAQSSQWSEKCQKYKEERIYNSPQESIFSCVLIVCTVTESSTVHLCSWQGSLRPLHSRHSWSEVQRVSASSCHWTTRLWSHRLSPHPWLLSTSPRGGSADLNLWQEQRYPGPPELLLPGRHALLHVHLHLRVWQLVVPTPGTRRHHQVWGGADSVEGGDCQPSETESVRASWQGDEVEDDAGQFEWCEGSHWPGEGPGGVPLISPVPGDEGGAILGALQWTNISQLSDPGGEGSQHGGAHRPGTVWSEFCHIKLQCQVQASSISSDSSIAKVRWMFTMLHNSTHVVEKSQHCGVLHEC